MISVAEFVKFRVFGGIEFEEAGVFRFDVRERGDFGDGGGFIAKREFGAWFGSGWLSQSCGRENEQREGCEQRVEFSAACE